MVNVKEQGKKETTWELELIAMLLEGIILATKFTLNPLLTYST